MERGTFLDVIDAKNKVLPCPHLYESVWQRQDRRCLESALSGSAHKFFDKSYDLDAVGLWQVINIFHTAYRESVWNDGTDID